MEISLQDYEFNFIQLKHFIDNTYGKSNISELIPEFTNNPNSLARHLKALYPFLTSRRMKHRFTHIRKQIENNNYENDIDLQYSPSELSDEESNFSQHY